MMRYVVINPANGYTYKGNGFLVLVGYGGSNGPTQGIGSEYYLIISNANGYKHECIRKSIWTDGSALTSNANMNSGTAFSRGVMVNGDSLTSARGGSGIDQAYGFECDTPEEAAALL